MLREFVFKTISGPPPSDDALYEKLLEAPFYGGPSPEAVEGEDALVSRGDVYRMPDGRWILCQKGCVNCDACERQKNPKVKWILRRVMRPASRPGSPKWDLRLTVFPQSRIVNEPSWNDAYSRSQDGLGGEAILHDSGPGTASGLARSWSNEETHSSEDVRIAEAGRSEDLPVSRRRSSGRMRVKRYRIKAPGRPGVLRFNQPQEDVTGTNGLIRRGDEFTPLLIMGIDQHGEKHLVHVVPVESSTDDRDSTIYRGSDRSDNSARIGRRTQHERDGGSYGKLMDRIMSSLNSHRSFIEKFIFADRLEPENQNVAVHPSYGFSDSQRGSADDGFDGRNFDDYRAEAYPGVNQYPVDSGYQMHERDDRLKGRYTDTEKEGVNKPSGEYRDQTIEYEPYVTSADGRQDERSLAPTDGERRRRNLVSKALVSTDPQGLGQNRTEIRTPDEKFSTKFSTDRELALSRSALNDTESGIDRSPGKTSNGQTLTVGATE